MNRVERPFLQRPVPALWAALILFVAAWVVYGPALNRVFVADQLWYFAELDGGTSFMDGLRHYDYAASRRFWKGDDALFRPLLFVWLAVQNALFSYHHVWWNVANLLVHSLVAWFLFQLLVTIQPSFWALPVSMLFVVLKPPLELVVWNHLGGYLWACVCLAIGLRGFVCLVRSTTGATSYSGAGRLVLGFTAAGLFYETMAPVSLLAALLIVLIEWRRGRRRSPKEALALFIPVLVFCSMYVFHALRVERFSYVDRPERTIFAPSSLIDLLPRCVDTVTHWIAELALPSAVALAPSTFGRFGKSFGFTWNALPHLLNAALILIGLVVLGCLLSWRHVKSVLPILALLVGALFMYAGVISLGRPSHEVPETSYYLYVPALLLVAFTYALADLERIRGWKTAAAGAVLAALVGLHASESAAVAREVGQVSDEASRLLTRLSRFVDARKDEPGFTFAILSHPGRIDPEVPLREGYPDDPRGVVHIRRVTEIVFRRYYDAVAPKHIFETAVDSR